MFTDGGVGREVHRASRPQPGANVSSHEVDEQRSAVVRREGLAKSINVELREKNNELKQLNADEKPPRPPLMTAGDLTSRERGGG